MNRLSINAKKDEKSPFPLENNELGKNFNSSKMLPITGGATERNETVVV